MSMCEYNEYVFEYDEYVFEYVVDLTNFSFLIDNCMLKYYDQK